MTDYNELREKRDAYQRSIDYYTEKLARVEEELRDEPVRFGIDNKDPAGICFRVATAACGYREWVLHPSIDGRASKPDHHNNWDSLRVSPAFRAELSRTDDCDIITFHRRTES